MHEQWSKSILCRRLTVNILNGQWFRWKQRPTAGFAPGALDIRVEQLLPEAIERSLRGIIGPTSGRAVQATCSARFFRCGALRSRRICPVRCGYVANGS